MDYEATGHIYSDRGTIIPSVTTILNPTASKPWFSYESASRGTLAHERCAAWALKPEGFPYEPYVDSFAMFCYKYNPKWLAIEEIIDGCVDGLRYAGRLDLFGEIDGKRTVVELKSGAKAKWHISQIAAYSLVKKAQRLLLLYLHNDMGYQEHWVSTNDLVSGIQDFRHKLKGWYDNRN
jgi:hypothetical protein